MFTQTEFAAHIGVSKMAVSRGVAKERLRLCLVRDDKGKVIGISDLALAAKEWAANGDYTDAPQRAPASVRDVLRERETGDDATEAPQELSLAGAAASAKHWDARLKELKYKEAAGELVAAKDVENKLADVFSEVKTKILGVATRMRQEDPTLSAVQLELFTSLLREALLALSGPGDE